MSIILLTQFLKPMLPQTMKKHKQILILIFSLCLLFNQPIISADILDDYGFASLNKENQKVIRVIRADTIILENNEKIRLIGIKAPEPPPKREVETDKFGFIIEPDNPLTPVEERAFNFAKFLLEGQTVRLEFDIQRRDKNFRTLAYVFLEDGTLVNAEIVRQGFAHLQIRPPNTKYADLLREAYQEARREKRGLQGE